jgi:hypothetical protein
VSRLIDCTTADVELQRLRDGEADVCGGITSVVMCCMMEGKERQRCVPKGRTNTGKRHKRVERGERPAHGVFVTADVCTMHSPSVKKGDRKKGDERGI